MALRLGLVTGVALPGLKRVALARLRPRDAAVIRLRLRRVAVMQSLRGSKCAAVRTGRRRPLIVRRRPKCAAVRAARRGRLIVRLRPRCAAVRAAKRGRLIVRQSPPMDVGRRGPNKRSHATAGKSQHHSLSRA